MLAMLKTMSNKLLPMAKHERLTWHANGAIPLMENAWSKFRLYPKILPLCERLGML